MMRRNKIKKIAPRNCPFCNLKTEPDFRDVEMLGRYVSDRGRIQAHTRTGICSKHQRAVTLAIKYARHIALLPFVG